MSGTEESQAAANSQPAADFGQTHFRILLAISLGHFLNDTTQSLLVPMYPLFKGNFALTFAQIGLITLTYQATASLLQPLVGLYTDKHPMPYSLSTGMVFSLTGLVTLALAPTYAWILLGAMLLGMGSSIFHPESSRVARMAAGGRFGLAQSVFQVGGNMGSTMGPILSVIILQLGQWSAALFAAIPFLGMLLLVRVGRWAKNQMVGGKSRALADGKHLPRKVVVRTLLVLLLLLFSKDFYNASITNYLIFYLQSHFGLEVRTGQLCLALYLFAVAVGTMLGGPIGDRIGRRHVIWGSIFGCAPFTLALPHIENVVWVMVLAVCVGVIMASAFSAILVLAQELLPGHVGMVSGLFFGLTFGMGGLGAAALGRIADMHGLDFVYQICAWLPLIGILAVFLPDIGRAKHRKA